MKRKMGRRWLKGSRIRMRRRGRRTYEGVSESFQTESITK